MEIGIAFPRDDVSNDAIAARDFVQAAEALGFTHLTAWDHVVGTPPPHPVAANTHEPAHEPLTLFAYLAAFTSRMFFVSNILILPQRQAVLVAKQASTVDFLSNGRLRLGVAVGWNPVEFGVMNENFSNRGRRLEEQLEVMRALWTQDEVDFHGKWHNMDKTSINPLPVQRPIPVWIGAYAEAAMQRAARLADGWFVQTPPTSHVGATPFTGAETIARMESYLAAIGRDRKTFNIHAHSFGAPPEARPDDWRKTVEGWRALGVDQTTFRSARDIVSPTLQDHIEDMRLFKDAVGL